MILLTKIFHALRLPTKIYFTFSDLSFFTEEILQFDLWSNISYIDNDNIIVYVDYERTKLAKKHPHFHIRDLRTQKDSAVDFYEAKYSEAHYNSLILNNDQKIELNTFLKDNFYDLIDEYNFIAKDLRNGMKKISNRTKQPDYTQLPD